MDERLKYTKDGTCPEGNAPEMKNGQEGGRDGERERLLAEAYMEIEQMKAAAMEEIHSSTAAYVHMQVEQACARAAEETRAQIYMEEQYKTALAKEQSRQFSRLGLTLFAFFAVTFAVQLAAAAALGVLSAIIGIDPDMESPVFLMLFSAIPMYAVAFPVAAALMHMIPQQGRAGGERWSALKLVACFVISVGIGFLGNIIGQLVNAFTSSGGDSGLMDEMLVGGGMLLNIAVVVFAAPIVEELLFRKFLIDRIAAYGDGVAVVISGLLFGLAHGNFSQFFYAFGIGALWAYVYVKTGNVGYTIAFHMLFNLIGGVFTVELSKGMMGLADPAGLEARLELLFGMDFGPAFEAVCTILMFAYLLFSFACMVGGAAILIACRKEIRFRPGERPIAWGKRFSTVVLNPGVLLFLGGCLWLFWLQM